MRTLVVYYSLTGHTQLIAETIAAELSSTIERIQDEKPRSNGLGALRSTWEMLFGLPGKILPTQEDPAQFDVVILGAPVWMMNVASPMRTYLSDQKSKFNKVAYFCTEGGSGGKRMFKTMEKICGEIPITTLEITEADLNANDYESKLKNFSRSIRLSVE